MALIYDYFAVVRQRRNIVTKFVICDKFNSLEKLEDCMSKDWDLVCKIKADNCYYMVKCKKRPTVYNYLCEQTHIEFRYPQCCEYICP